MKELEPSLAWTGPACPGAGPLNPIKEQAQLRRAGLWARVPSWLGRLSGVSVGRPPLRLPPKKREACAQVMASRYPVKDPVLPAGRRASPKADRANFLGSWTSFNN